MDIAQSIFQSINEDEIAIYNANYILERCYQKMNDLQLLKLPAPTMIPTWTPRPSANTNPGAHTGTNRDAIALNITMYIPERKPLFRKNVRKTNPYGVAAMLAIIIVLSSFCAVSTRVRSHPCSCRHQLPPVHWILLLVKGAVYFGAGDLDKAIEAYQQAVALDPGNAELHAELARIMVYSSTLLTMDQERIDRLEEALAMINSAVEMHRKTAWCMPSNHLSLIGWQATQMTQAESEAMLNEAEQEAIYAIQLDNQNMLALAYYAEILVDQQKWIQAEQNIREAVRPRAGYDGCPPDQWICAGIAGQLQPGDQ